MNVKNSDTINISDREIVTRRVIDFPRELVFLAWTDPKRLANWWGPNGFRNTFQEFDQKPGGHWRLIMHGPDGTDYPNHSVFQEILEPERIVFEHLSNPNFQVTATFEKEGDKTKLTFRMLFHSIEECDQVKKYVVDANEQNMDRLEAELAKMV